MKEHENPYWNKKLTTPKKKSDGYVLVGHDLPDEDESIHHGAKKIGNFNSPEEARSHLREYYNSTGFPKNAKAYKTDNAHFGESGFTILPKHKSLKEHVKEYESAPTLEAEEFE